MAARNAGSVRYIGGFGFRFSMSARGPDRESVASVSMDYRGITAAAR